MWGTVPLLGPACYLFEKLTGFFSILSELTRSSHPPPHGAESFNTLVKAFSSHDNVEYEEFLPPLARLRRVVIPEDHVLWRQDDGADCLYLIESGTLRASYQLVDYEPPAEEAMAPGTLASVAATKANSRLLVIVIAGFSLADPRLG